MNTIVWDLPGMENFTPSTLDWFARLLEEGDIVQDVTWVGWAYWPTQSKGFLTEHYLRLLADFLEIQNKPYWEEYDEYCRRAEEQSYAAQERY